MHRDILVSPDILSWCYVWSSVLSVQLVSICCSHSMQRTCSGTELSKRVLEYYWTSLHSKRILIWISFASLNLKLFWVAIPSWYKISYSHFDSIIHLFHSVCFILDRYYSCYWFSLGYRWLLPVRWRENFKAWETWDKVCRQRFDTKDSGHLVSH